MLYTYVRVGAFKNSAAILDYSISPESGTDQTGSLPRIFVVKIHLGTSEYVEKMCHYSEVPSGDDALQTITYLLAVADVNQRY